MRGNSPSDLERSDLHPYDKSLAITLKKKGADLAYVAVQGGKYRAARCSAGSERIDLHQFVADFYAFDSLLAMLGCNCSDKTLALSEHKR